MGFQQIIEQFKERKILASLSIYAASAWAIIEVLTTVSPYLGIPDFAVKIVVHTSVLLFPFLIFYFWVLSTRSSKEETGTKRSWKTWMYGIADSAAKKCLSVLLIAGLVLLSNWSYETYSSAGQPLASSMDSDSRLAILPFENSTGTDELKSVGSMISHWLTEGFIENGQEKVISSKSVQRAYATKIATADISTLSKMVYSELGAQYVVDGSYFLLADSLYIKCQLIDAESHEVVHSFGTIAGEKEKPIKVIETLREKVLGYWHTKDLSQRFPAPRYDAYKKYLEAQEIWGADNARVKKLLEESIELDPSFFEPQFLLLAEYRNERKYVKCDSLVKFLYKNKSKLRKAQLEKVHFFKYELEGQYSNAYPYLETEYNRDEQDLFINTSIAHFSEFALNNSKETLELAEPIVLDSIDFENCHYCQTRLFVLAIANFRLGKFEEALSICLQDSEAAPDWRVKEIRALCYFHLNKEEELNQLLKETKEKSDYYYLSFLKAIATESLKFKGNSSSLQWVKMALQDFKNKTIKESYTSELVAQLFEMQGDVSSAKHIYQNLARENADASFYAFRIAACEAQEGNFMNAVEVADSLSALAPPFDFAYHNYECARIYSLAGKSTKALELLGDSIDKGRMFYFKFYDRDWYLKSLWKERAFQKLLESRRGKIKSATL